MIYDTWKSTKFGQIEVLRQQEAELERLEREEAMKEAEEALARGEPVPPGTLVNKIRSMTHFFNFKDTIDLSEQQNNDPSYNRKIKQIG